jgi:CheY-like chemotaxis protein
MKPSKILLVDDDPEDHMVIREAMDNLQSGHVLHFLFNGIQALDMLEKLFNTDELPCLIVLDLNMPKLNGTQTLERLKKDRRFSDIPVIIYSTSINVLEKEKCMLLGAHSYITKPISYSQSIDTAKVFLEFCV